MNILMPQLGETVAEGKITKWFKSAGDAVKPGDNLFEIETDKVSMEVPATEAGILSEIRVPEGDVAPVGAVVGVIGDGSAGVVSPSAKSGSAVAEPPKASGPASAPQAPASPPKATPPSPLGCSSKSWSYLDRLVASTGLSGRSHYSGTCDSISARPRRRSVCLAKPYSLPAHPGRGFV